MHLQAEEREATIALNKNTVKARPAVAASRPPRPQEPALHVSPSWDGSIVSHLRKGSYRGFHTTIAAGPLIYSTQATTRAAGLKNTQYWRRGSPQAKLSLTGIFAAVSFLH